MPPVAQLNAQRLRTTLKMAISKLKFLQEKKSALTKQQRRQLADLLSAGKETSAKIRVENIIRDDIYIELLEYCELFCELLLARNQIILDLSRTEVDSGLHDAVSSVIYCCNFTEIKELVTLGDILRSRYGPEYTRKVLDNEGGDIVPPRIISRCDIEPPSESLVNLYLSEIAKTYEVPFSGTVIDDVSDVEDVEEDDIEINSDDSSDGGSKEPMKMAIAPTLKEMKGVFVDEDEAKVDTPTKPVSKASTEKNEFNLLKERFAALKRN